MAKQFLIVGANSGIGREVFTLLSKDGHEVFTTSRGVLTILIDTSLWKI